METSLAPTCPKTQEILNLFKTYGLHPYTEEISILSHAFQAGLLAKEQGMDGDMIVAALLHDIGLLLLLKKAKQEVSPAIDDASDEQIGADYLHKLGFSQAIVATCRYHMRAMRYLCFKSETYHDRLSEAYKQTLVALGGPMTLAEAIAFEADPHFSISLDIRYLNEEAQIKDFEPSEADWKYFAHMIEIHVA